MNISLKLLIKNILEKKMRTGLIIFSITIAAALFFASISISDTMVNIFTDKINKTYGQSEIVISANDKSPSKYFSPDIALAFNNSFNYTVGAVEDTALYKPTKDETTVFNLKGMNWEDIQIMSPVQLEQQENMDPFEARKIVISSIKAKKFGLNTGDTINLQIDETIYKFKIAGIASSSGMFTGEEDLAIVPKDILSCITSQKGNISKLYIKLKNPAEKDTLIKEMSDSINRYDVKETISKQELKERTTTFTSVLALMLMIIIFLSVFIIYVSFKVIIAERLPLLGTLRSIGASKRATYLILFGESMIYGVVGGLLACGFGVVVLYLMALLNSDGKSATIIVNVIQFPMTLGLAIVLSLLSALLPIWKVTGISIKDIVLNKVELKDSHRKIWKLGLGVVFLASSFIIPSIFDGTMALIADTICMVLAIVAIVLLTPHFTAAFMLVCEKLYVLLFGNVGVLAAKNLRDNRNILNNICLLAIGVATVLMVSTAGKSVAKDLTFATGEFMNFDLSFTVAQMDRTVESNVRASEGVTDVCGFYIAEEVEVPGYTEKIKNLEGINKSKFLQFKSINTIINKTENAFEKLDEGRNIILSTTLSSRYGASVGDTITLVLNKQKRQYTVIDLVDTLNEEGSYAMISDRYFKLDTGNAYYNSLGIKTNGNAETLFNSLKNKFSRSAPLGMIVKEKKLQILKEGSDITSMMSAISILTVIIGIFGVFNNLTISFIQRKQSLAVYKSVGMSKTQLVNMILIEALSGGLVGGILGAFTGWAMLCIMPYLTKALMATIPMQYSINTFVLAAISGAFITIIASVSTAMKSSKLSIVQAIKYE